MEALRRVFAVSVFPLVMGASLAVSIAFLDAGNPLAALGAPSVGAALLILGLERVFPHQRSWNRARGDVPVDLAHVVSVSATTTLLQPLIAAAALPAAAALEARFGNGVWPVAWPWLLQLPLALVVAELPKYWLHRLEHETDALWRFHATHHSVTRLYWLNSARFHPVDIGLDTVAGFFTLVALGCPPPVLVLFAVVSAVHGYFQHANLQLRLGPLNWFFSMAELHRWHHSRTIEEANHNYGQNLSVWDLVFGTFYLPADREPPEAIGLAALPAFPTRYWAQLASPFRWRRIREASAAALSRVAPASR